MDAQHTPKRSPPQTRLAAAIVCIASGMAGAAHADSPHDTPLTWLSGCWTTEDAALVEQWVFEGGYLFGHAVSYAGGNAVFFEQMRIETTGTPTFYAYPAGEGPFAFPATSQTDTTIVFANADHDFPQRITYQRLDDGVQASISLSDGSNATHFSFMPCEAD